MKLTKKQMVLGGVGVTLLLAITLLAMPVIGFMAKPDFQQWMTTWVEQAGLWGIVVLFFVQMAQIFIAIIPGEPIEVVAGVMYGAVGGLVICMVGIVLASATIFTVVRKLGRERLSKTKIYPKIMSYDFLNNEK